MGSGGTRLVETLPKTGRRIEGHGGVTLLRMMTRRQNRWIESLRR